MRLRYFTILLSITTATVLGAQSSSDASARSNAIAASFNKFKHKSVEKRGVRKEKYLRVESEPVVKQNPADYSGRYDVPDMDFQIEFQVNADGTFVGSGYDAVNENVKRTFTLRNGRIRGALATATKVYANGASEPFEGAFMNRSVYESPIDKGVTIFGFGMRNRAFVFNGQTIDRLFYERTRQ